MRLRFGSFFFLILFVSLVLLIPAVIWGTLLGHREDLFYAAICLGVAAISGIMYLILGTGVRCPLCHVTILGRAGCSRNRKAQRLLGSYRLAVAIRVLLIGRFRCPYCGEPCKCETRR